MSMPQGPRLAGILDHIDVLQADLLDRAAVKKVITDWRPDCCVHLAWYVEPGKYLESHQNIDALKAGIDLIQALAEAGCSHFVGAGTCFEYDFEQGWLHEDSATKPASLYAASKLALALTGSQIAALAGMKFAWGRIFYLYGPTEDPRRVVPAVATKIMNGMEFAATPGDAVRDFLHVDDVGAGFATIAESTGEGIFNISSGTPYEMRDIMRRIAQIAGHPELLKIGAVPNRAWEPPFICGDNSRLRAFGWAPQYDLESGLRMTLDWLRAQ